MILIPFASASVLFDDWVDNGDTFKAGDHVFYVESIADDRVILKMDNIGGIMYTGECETRDNIKYCFEELDQSQIRVKIESLEPDISIERIFSTTTPRLGEEIKVTVTLKNNGDKGATNAKYSDPYPSELKVYSSTWEGKISVGEEETVTYTIKAEDIVSFDSTATLSYNFGGKTKTKKSSVITINVQKPFTMGHEISTEAADKNEVVTYNLTIKNNDDSDKLNIENLEILLPAKISLVSASSTLEDDLTFSGTIEKKESKNFGIKIKSSNVGKFTIKTKADFKTSNRDFKEEVEDSLSVGLSDILPTLNLTDKVKSNSQYNIHAAVKNYGKDEIRDVEIKLEGNNLFTDVEEKKNLAAGISYDVLKRIFTAPYVEQDKKYNIKLSGSYLSSRGKQYTFEKSSQLTVTAAPKIIQIIRELNKEEYYPGDEIKVTVKIKNTKNIAIDDIDLSDIFPKEIRSSLLGDVTAVFEELKPNEEKKAYSYSVVIPADYQEDEMEFKTNLNVRIDGELTILKRIDKVKIIKGEKPEEVKKEQKTIAEERGTQEETEEQEIEITEEAKENIFKKIANWIKNLFKLSNDSEKGLENS